MKCLVCEKQLKEHIGRGRPREYCSDECANFMKYFTAMEKNLFLINLPDDAKRHIKGDLFRVGNGLKIATKSIKRTDNNEELRLTA